MDISIILLFSVLFLVLFFIKNQSKGVPVQNDVKYRYQKAIFLSNAEYSFYKVLQQSLPCDVSVSCKPRMVDVIKPVRTEDSKLNKSAFRKVSQKHFDFVLTRDGKVICAVELNDNSHNEGKQVERDRFVKEACDSASLPLVTIKARRGYSISDVKERLQLVF